MIQRAAATVLALYLILATMQIAHDIRQDQNRQPPSEPAPVAAYVKAMRAYDPSGMCANLSPRSGTNCADVASSVEQAASFGYTIDTIELVSSRPLRGGGFLLTYYTTAHATTGPAEAGMLVYTDEQGKVVKVQ